MKPLVRHDEWLMVQLADAEFATEYLNAASVDDDPKTYLTAMRKVGEARGGMALLQKRHLSPERLCIELSQQEVIPVSKPGQLF